MNRVQKECEVLVIGGGPGGAMASSYLAQQNRDVVLFEKEVSPLMKVGENIIPHFWKYADLMGVSDKIANAGFVFKSGGSTYWDDSFKKMKFSDFKYNRLGLHVERDQFDKILLDHIETQGAKVHYQIRAKKVVNHENSVEVHYQDLLTKEEGVIIAKQLVDASGQSSLIGFQENLKEYDEGFRFNAYWGYYTGGHFLDINGKFTEFGKQLEINPLTLISTIGDWGWIWHIILQKSTSIGIIVPKDKNEEFRSKGNTLAERFDHVVKNTPLTGALMEDAVLDTDSIKSIVDYAYQPKSYTHGNCFLVGDAAAFVDPINSAGVVMAMYAGYLSAWCIERILKNPDRKEKLRAIYAKQLKARVELFRLLAYPSDEITEEMMLKSKELVKQVGMAENQLSMTQCSLTNRAKNLPDLMGEGVMPKFVEIPLDQILSTKPDPK
jgi:halogenation protein CepH